MFLFKKKKQKEYSLPSIVMEELKNRNASKEEIQKSLEEHNQLMKKLRGGK